MRILWLIGTSLAGFPPTADRALVAGSSAASDRLRVAIPARLLEPRGIMSEFCGLDPALPLPDATRYDAVVFGKFTTVRQHDAARAALWTAFFEAARSAGCRLIADVSDNPFFAESSRAEFYRTILGECDAVTVPTLAMAEEIRPARSHALVVSDPYEGEFRLAQFSAQVPLQVLWFGHRSNYPYLQRLGPELAALAADHPLSVHVVSSGIADIEHAIARTQALFGDRLRLRYTEWSVQATRDALDGCDLVIIPSDAADPRKRGASPNRLTESLVAGRLPVASPLESYRPFGASALVVENIVDGIRHALSNAPDMTARIETGQALVRARHAPEVVAAEWYRALAA